ncbi:MAG: T9SS type A sorting domain-containing protein, partial [Bacteroidales bacterium]|nr:T9SS type A sorting domain-containing protein [Bacteroidales bacterium]
DPLYIFACSKDGLGIVTSSTGPGGPFTLQDNLGFSAVRVRSIERNGSKSIFYVATGSGLAYTTVFNDPFIPNYDKWHPPYGEFPVSNAGTGFGTSAVAIDPADDQHVITGFGEGLSYTMTGPTGFTDVYPTGWHTSPSLFVKDIRLANSLVVIAVVGGENSEAKDLGDIWRSDDGGISWTKVTPTGFNNGNTIAMGVLGTDTVLYVGTGLAVTSIENEGILWKSTDIGLTWTMVNYGPTGYNPDGSTINHVPIYDIAVDPRGKDTLYVAGGCNLNYALDKSINGGVSYTPITCAIGEGSFSAVVVHQIYPDTLFMAIRRDIMAYHATTNTCCYIYRGFPGENIPDLEFGSLFAGTSTGFYQITSYMDPPSPVNEFPLADQKGLILFPNPTTNQVHIGFKTEKETIVRVEIFSSLGQQVITKAEKVYPTEEQTITIDCSGLPPGVYFVKFVDSDRVLFSTLIKL